MRLGYIIRDQSAIHFVTFTIIEWANLFSKVIYKDIFIENLKFYVRNQGLKVHAFVIMSNHVHLIVSSTQPKNDLSSIIGRIKSYTSKQFLAILKSGNDNRSSWLLEMFRKAVSDNSRNKDYQVWIQHNHPIELNTNEMIDQKLEYIHNNPVKAQIVGKSSDYIYSSAPAYAGLWSIMKIDFLD